MDATTHNVPSRIELRDIKKSFGAVQALQGVNISLAPGEVLGLVGDNGAGKSTLMKILSGAQAPDSGSILLDGKEVRFSHPRDARAEHIEMVYQDLSLCEELDVAGNLFLGREPRWGAYGASSTGARCTGTPPRRWTRWASGSSTRTCPWRTSPAASVSLWR